MEKEPVGTYAKVRLPWMRALVATRYGALAVHWLFQGLLYMDPTERVFKLATDVLLTGVLTIAYRNWLPTGSAIMLAFLSAHTVNFLANAHIFGVLKHFGGVRTEWPEFQAEIERFRRRLAAHPDVHYAAAYGSLAREEWTTTSDLDVRIVRASGWRSGLRMCVFAAVERARANLIGFPLDLYVFDRADSLRKMSESSPIELARHPSFGSTSS